MHEAQIWCEDMNRMVEKMNQLKKEFRAEFSGQPVEEVDFEQFDEHRRKVVKIKQEWIQKLSDIQEQMGDLGVEKFPPEVSRVNSLLEKMLLRVKDGRIRIEKFKEEAI